MNIDKKTKQPHEVLDYDIDCTKGTNRMSDDDTIKSITLVSIDGPDEVLFQPVPATWSDIIAKVWLAGGMDGSVYKITVLIETNGGRKVEKEFLMFVKER